MLGVISSPCLKRQAGGWESPGGDCKRIPEWPDVLCGHRSRPFCQGGWWFDA